jgi:hypothetical protein
MVQTTSQNRCTLIGITKNHSLAEPKDSPSSVKPLAVDPNQAAALLSSTYSSLEKDRATGHMGVPYVKAGRRVIYRLADLDKWLTANRIVPSSKGVNHE